MTRDAQINELLDTIEDPSYFKEGSVISGLQGYLNFVKSREACKELQALLEQNTDDLALVIRRFDKILSQDPYTIERYQDAILIAYLQFLELIPDTQYDMITEYNTALLSNPRWVLLFWTRQYTHKLMTDGGIISITSVRKSISYGFKLYLKNLIDDGGKTFVKHFLDKEDTKERLIKGLYLEIRDSKDPNLVIKVPLKPDLDNFYIED